MRPTDNINQLIKKLHIKASANLDGRVHDDIDRALATRQKSESADAKPNRWRIIMKSRIMKLAAAAVIVMAVLVGIHQFGGSIDSGGVAFGRVLEHIQNSSYTFDLAVVTEEGASGTVEAMMLEPGRMRVDMSTGLGRISSIVDVTKNKSLILFHKQKAAMVETPGTDRYREAVGILALTMKPIENLWNLRDGTPKKLGKKDIDGQSAEGFMVFQEDESFKYQITVWANAKTGIPILVEMVLSSLQDLSKSMRFTMNNFNLDVKLNKELFTLEVPVGYTLAYQLDLDELEGQTNSTNEAEEVEKVLALWSEDKKREAVEVLLGVDWTKSFVFSKKSYLFTVTEKECIALKPEARKQVMIEIISTSSLVKLIVKEVLGLGQAALSNQDYKKSEKYFDAGLQLGKLLTTRPERMIIVRLTGISVQKKVLNEMTSLYTAMNHKEKLRAVEMELQALEAEQKKIKEGLAGQ